eukprot:TRINITY_DN23455_c0_g2_i1.p1 TRINITY_DN23455_c0_g2~~TRINITY_DN23455_c0_g2_i1.p1  ORF type:complete len:308 (-),score=77.07 TRINITY_DN23455_c0_g2_i1:308-1231(-)
MARASHGDADRCHAPAPRTLVIPVPAALRRAAAAASNGGLWFWWSTKATRQGWWWKSRQRWRSKKEQERRLAGSGLACGGGRGDGTSHQRRGHDEVDCAAGPAGAQHSSPDESHQISGAHYGRLPGQQARGLRRQDATSSNAATKKYFDDTEELDAKQKEARGPVHVVAWRALIKWLLAVAEKYDYKEDKDDPALKEQQDMCRKAVTALKDIEQMLEKQKPEVQVAEVCRKVRYCRISTCYKEKQVKLELASGHSQAGLGILNDILTLMKVQHAAIEKQGVAPRGNMERLVRQQMVAMGIEISNHSK